MMMFNIVAGLILSIALFIASMFLLMEYNVLGFLIMLGLSGLIYKMTLNSFK